MSNSSAATRIAIIVGAGIGALAAVLAGAPRTPPVEAPRRAPTREAPAPESVESPREAPGASAAKSAPSALPKTPSPSPSELDPLPVAELERRCALRQPKACLASARGFDSGGERAPDAAKARLYRALAVSLLDERCLARDAESCHDLATLYQSGTGVPRNPATATALSQRARELCAGRTTSFCERLGAATVGE